METLFSYLRCHRLCWVRFFIISIVTFAFGNRRYKSKNSSDIIYECAISKTTTTSTGRGLDLPTNKKSSKNIFTLLHTILICRKSSIELTISFLLCAETALAGSWTENPIFTAFQSKHFSGIKKHKHIIKQHEKSINMLTARKCQEFKHQN